MEASEKWTETTIPCDYCGGKLEVLTQSKKPDFFYDGDDVRCLDCDYKYQISIHEDEDGNAYAYLNEVEDESK